VVRIKRILGSRSKSFDTAFPPPIGIDFVPILVEARIIRNEEVFFEKREKMVPERVNFPR